jgi:hypothetical protein
MGFHEALQQPVQVGDGGEKKHDFILLAFGLEQGQEPFSRGIQPGFGQFGGSGQIFLVVVGWVDIRKSNTPACVGQSRWVFVSRSNNELRNGTNSTTNGE